jgi:integrase
MVLARVPGGKPVWKAIGKTHETKLADAQAETRRRVQELRTGIVQKPEAPVALLTLNDVVRDYAARKGRRQHRWADKERRINNWLLRQDFSNYGKKPFIELDNNDAHLLLRRIVREDGSRQRLADQVRLDLAVLEKHFMGMGQRPKNYVVQFRGDVLPRVSEKKSERKRHFDDEELSVVWRAAGKAGRFGVIVKLALYTGQRIMKILTMQWDHVNTVTGEWRIPWEEGEKFVPGRLRLPPAAVELIRSQQRLTPYVFHSVRGTGHMIGIAELKEDFERHVNFLWKALPPKPGDPPRTDMAPWVIHDLRRTCRTLLSQAKIITIVRAGNKEHEIKVRIDREISEAILGHARKGVEGTYNRDEYVDEIQEALAALADHIHRIVGENVVSLPAAKKKPRAKRQTREAASA